ncbi:hypothetical protein J4214_05945 [Candidatus Woesearchaeota archaeon]|nr:hypothetical protein [Candidatus Woesearchaeota archaeon]
MAKPNIKSSVSMKSEGKNCMHCGKDGCGCGTWMIIAGIIMIILGIWLWKIPDAWPLILAIAFVLGGLKKIMIGFKWGKGS